MSKPILYYIPGSPPARTTILVAKTLALDVELRLVDMANKEHLRPEFLRLNPQHTVPTLVLEDGQSLWDSHAIATYLVERYAPAGHQLYPSDPLQRARIHQRLHFDTSVLFPLIADLYLTFAVHGGIEMRDETTPNVWAAFDMLETFLATDKYLVGDAMTVADLSAITSVTQIARHVPVEVAKWPQLAAWMARFEAELAFFAEFNTKWVDGYVLAREADIVRNKAAKEQ